MNQIYTEACVAIINDDIQKFSEKFNQPLVKDYDDFDYFEALYFTLSNGIPYELQCYRGYEENTFTIMIPPALEDYEEVIKQILDILDVDKSLVTLYLDEYERSYSIVTWNERLKEMERKKNEEK